MTRQDVLNALMTRIESADPPTLHALHREIDDPSMFTVIERAFLEGAIALATRIRLGREATASPFHPLSQEHAP